MNVWIVNHYAIPPSMGGLVRHYYFSKYLQKKGHQVKIFTASKVHNTEINMITDKSLYKEKMMDQVEYTFVRSRDYKGNGIDRIINMIDFPFKIRKAMKTFYKEQRPDVIYTSSPDLFVAFFALLFGRKHGIPVVVEIRDLWPESIVEYNKMSKKNPVIQILYQLEKWIYKKADRIIFTMPGGKEYIRDRGWDRIINLDKVYHLNNGVDIEEFEHNKMIYKLEDSDLNNQEVYKVIYVGSIRLANHLGELIEAAQILKERGRDDILFLIYGEGTEKQKLQEECEKKQLNVKFKGKIEKKYIPYVLNCSDLNVINVKNTGLTKYGCSWNKLFEYIASEKPLLCNFPQGKYDLIIQNGLGVSRKFETREQYAEQILQFVDMGQNECEKIMENSRRIKMQYDYKKFTEELISIIDRNK